MTVEEIKQWIIDHWGGDLDDYTKQSEVVRFCLDVIENEQKLKEAVKKIKDEIRETYAEFRDNDVFIANGITMCNRIIKRHTEGLI